MAEGETNRLNELKKQLAKSRALKAQGVQFVVEDFYDNKIVRALKDGRQLGTMELKPPSDQTNFKGAREVKMIDVARDVQRQGVGTALFNEAKKLGLNPVHSNRLSSEGRAFSAAQGGTRIPNPELTNQELRNFTADKARSKNQGKLTAKEIAIQRMKQKTLDAAPTRQTPSGPPQPDPEALRIKNQLLGRANQVPMIRPGLNFLGGGANILSFLPMILEGGKIAQGTSSMLPRFDRVN